MNDAPVDYPRWWYAQHAHHMRFKAYVKAHGRTCQACGGSGKDGYDSYEYGPADPCGWCETTGLMSNWLRGQYLTYMRSLKPKRKAS